MDIFQQLITSLNPEEQRNYKLLCGRSHGKEDRKDIALFDYTRKAEKRYDEPYILKQIYGSRPGGQNSLYRLKNKVKADVQRSINYLNFDESTRATAYNNLLLFEHFKLRQQYPLALHYLKRAEEAAKRDENYGLLDLIYAGALELSQSYFEFSPLEYIAARKQNQKKLELQNQMEEIYTQLNYHIKTSLNYSQQKISGTRFLKQYAADYDKIKELKNNPAFQLKIFRTLAQALVQQHNYSELVSYTLTNLARFETKGWLTGPNLDTKLQMLVYVCNGLYKQDKYFESLKYTADLKKEMEAAGAELSKRYSFYYYSLLIYNYIKTEPAKAVEVCNQLLAQLKASGNAQMEYITLINKAIAQGEMNSYDDAIGTLNRVFINDYFRGSDAAFKMKIFMAEVILYLLSGDYKYCGQRLKAFGKQYHKLLMNKEYAAEAEMAEIIELALKTAKGKAANRKLLLQKADSFIKTKSSPGAEDTQIFKYKVCLGLFLKNFKA